MRGPLTGEFVSLDGAGETAAFGLTNHVNDITIGKLIDQYLVADIQFT